jgi:hypothetical protein
MTCPLSHKHGRTHTCYNAHGCRCDMCVHAKAVKRNRYDWEARRRKGADVHLPATGTVRRLQALAVMGWAIPELCALTGLSVRPLSRIREGNRAHVTMSTYMAVKTVYERLELQHNHTREGRIAATWAARHGWLPPLAWDDPDTDKQPRRAA